MDNKKVQEKLTVEPYDNPQDDLQMPYPTKKARRDEKKWAYAWQNAQNRRKK